MKTDMTAIPTNEIQILELIDAWYHEHTRHHLVDVDPSVFDNLIKPVAQHSHKAVEEFAEKLRKQAELVWLSDEDKELVVPVSAITEALKGESKMKHDKYDPYKPTAKKAIEILKMNLPLEELGILHTLLGEYLNNFSTKEGE